MNTFKVRCCGLDPYWVENIPGKGYLFCGECKNEVLQPLAVEEAPVVQAEEGKTPYDYSYWEVLRGIP